MRKRPTPATATVTAIGGLSRTAEKTRMTNELRGEIAPATIIAAWVALRAWEAISSWRWPSPSRDCTDHDALE
jgi:hypothetical protein